ncbi:carbonic anhydrase family protein [Chryseobacterium sp. S0630]|uniref:carbonic anhydrase family protein n=1 Tax=Chryseobacterium sp. S0630 TaxID=2957803 RepID=UPI0020A0D268|nr:carbonic anhydrase family protein [Chryseobacterium sp. S0630]MCP1301258.1 carbonic anhydrase family protein [Chryseobacterium sp. S0630]
MMKKKLPLLIIVLLLFSSCKQIDKNESTAMPKVQTVSNVMTKETQEKLTPDEILKELVEGNKRFQRGNITLRNFNEQARKCAIKQYPKAVILSCLDSRVPVEVIFDQGLGDVFVGRVAGNFVNEDLLGSMEFACHIAGSKLILVIGHQHCGAIKGAIDNVEFGNITAMLSKIKPAVQMSQNFTGKKSSKNEEFVKYVSKNNVSYTLNQIRKNSSILREMENRKEIKIVGAYYNLVNGTLEFVK